MKGQQTETVTKWIERYIMAAMLVVGHFNKRVWSFIEFGTNMAAVSLSFSSRVMGCNPPDEICFNCEGGGRVESYILHAKILSESQPPGLIC